MKRFAPPVPVRLELLVCLGLAFVLLSGSLAAAQAPTRDWPHWLGPHRDGSTAPIAVDDGSDDLALREVWRRPAPRGQAAVVVLGDLAVTLISDPPEAEDPQEWALALDRRTGAERWRAPLGPLHPGAENGPVSTPALDGERVYALSSTCILTALDAGDGEPVWRRDLPADLGAGNRVRGCTTSPLLADGRLIVQVSGDAPVSGSEETGSEETGNGDGAAAVPAHRVVSFDPADGTVQWTSPGAEKGYYTSPALITFEAAGLPPEDRRQVLVYQVSPVRGVRLYGLRFTDGEFLWQQPVPSFSFDTPIPVGGSRVFLGTFDDGALFALDPTAPEPVTQLWRTQGFQSLYGMPVVLDGTLYGHDSEELTAIDLATGEVLWREEIYHGALARAGDLLVTVGHYTGMVRLIRASREGYRELDQEQVLNIGAPTETAPTIAHGMVFVRNLEEVVALEVVRAGEAGSPEESSGAGADEEGSWAFRGAVQDPIGLTFHLWGNVGDPASGTAASDAALLGRVAPAIDRALAFLDESDNFTRTGANDGHHPLEIWVTRRLLELYPHPAFAADVERGWADTLAHPDERVWANLPREPALELSEAEREALAASLGERHLWDRWFLWSMYPDLPLDETTRATLRGEVPAGWNGYDLSHRLYAARLLRTLHPATAAELRLDPLIAEARRAMVHEMHWDHPIRDLWVERLAFLLEDLWQARETGEPVPAPRPRWIERLLDSQNQDGGWGAAKRLECLAAEATGAPVPCQRSASHTHTTFLAAYALVLYRALHQGAPADLTAP